MLEEEMNAYRFISGEEPSDEMLSQLMKEVAEEAVIGNREAAEMHLAEMVRNIAVKKAKWEKRIKETLHVEN
ncbi:MAG: hypothetical protein J1F29_05900 [Lentimicrobiaceae bacterium]|nr:hypothetical protein [Lentimicrobiaceae bacterium]